MGYEITRVAAEAAQEQSPWIAGAIGVIGAVAGSVTTILWTEHFNRRQAWERSNALAFNVMTKLEEMYSLLSAIRKNINEARAELAKEEAAAAAAPPIIREGVRLVPQFFLHMYLQSAVSSLPEREITGDELWAINRVGGSRLLTQIAPISRRYNGVMQAFRQYSRMREAPDASFNVVGANGIVATMEIDPSNHRQMLLLASLENLANDVARITDESTMEVFSALRGLAYAHRRPFGEKAKITTKNPEGREITFAAKDAPRYRNHWWQTWRKKYDHDDISIEI